MALGGSVTVEELFEKNEKEQLRCFSFYKAGDKKYTGTEKSVLAMLNEFRKDERSGFCDVIIQVEGVDLPAHRCILAANSKLFFNMFNSGMRESEEKLVKLQSVSSDAMQSLLQYFYTREITIAEEVLEELLDAANFLLVKPVQQACFEVMSVKLGFSNCFTYRYLAQKYDASDLFKKADNFIKKNFARVWRESEEFVGLSFEELADLISSDEILVKSEEDVYSAVMKWINYDVANRRGFLVQLLSHLRCGSLTKLFIKGRLLNDPLIKDCRASSSVLETWIKVKTKKKKTKGPKSNIPVRPSTKVHDVVVMFEDSNEYDRHDCCGYDVSSSERIRLPCIPHLHRFPDIAVVNQSVFLIGGVSDWSDDVSHVSSLTLTSDSSGLLSWKRKASFSEKRSSFAVAVLGKNIYLVGGSSASSNIPVATVECYDSDADTWQKVSSLTQPRCNLGAVGMQNFVLAIGGCVGSNKESTDVVEKYNPTQNMWVRVAPLHQKRRCPHTVCFGSKIYVVGGIQSSSPYPFSCEVYSVRANEWSLIPNFQHPHQEISYLKLLGAFPLDGVPHFCFSDEIDGDEVKVLKLNSKGCRLEKSEQVIGFGPLSWQCPYRAFLVQVSKFHLKLLPEVDESSSYVMDDYDDDSYDDSWNVFDDYDDYDDDDMMEDEDYGDWGRDWMF